MSGILSQMKDNTGKPIHPTHTFADLIGAIAASESILAALVQRGKTGKGTYLDIAIADVMVSLMINHILIQSGTGEGDGISFLNNKVICYALYETKDGRYISLAALESKFWQNFCQAVHKEEWVPAQFTPPAEENPVYQEVKELFKQRTFAEWCAFSRKVDCCMTPVLETEELIDQPYIKERNLIKNVGGLRYALTRPGGQSFLDSDTPYPKLGEHTDEILASLRKGL
jgi:crotonobetainyl-CoA:carnitine CoA-transferase CaiB-like acyl-CoA transferase